MRTFSRLGSLLALSAMTAAATSNSVLIRDMEKASPLPPKSPDSLNEQELLAQAKRNRKAARRARLAGY